MATTDYSRVPDIVDSLRAEGLTPSADRVRGKLGSGSNQTIQREINTHLRTLGLLPQEDQEEEEPPRPLALSAGDWAPPEPDPDEVAGHLARLRQESHDLETASYLQASLAIARCLAEVLPGTIDRLRREHARTQVGLSFGRTTDWPHRQAADALLVGLAPLMRASETILHTLMVGAQEATDGDGAHKPAA